MTVVAVMMSGSYLTVAYGRHVSWQLLGVTFAAFQGGLGEASTLALCSLYDSRRALTLWSSGTGFAGIATPALHDVTKRAYVLSTKSLTCLASSSDFTHHQYVCKMIRHQLTVLAMK